jgi:hypothetical protein
VLRELSGGLLKLFGPVKISFHNFYSLNILCAFNVFYIVDAGLLAASDMPYVQALCIDFFYPVVVVIQLLLTKYTIPFPLIDFVYNPKSECRALALSTVRDLESLAFWSLLLAPVCFLKLCLGCMIIIICLRRCHVSNRR